MKRIIVALVLILVIYVLGTLVSKQISTFINQASLNMRGMNVTELNKQIRAHVNEHILENNITLDTDAQFELQTTYINTDNGKDVIARIVAPQTCGTGGCITVILLKTESGDFKALPFAYSVKELAVQNSITNGMHDVMINNDSENLMKWDGEQYTLNAM